ncbi:MAG: SpoIIE family protein phosphatase, partial [Candidatus Eremiobacteraeota bacterium]|nr:SpoIIE family protein phosphatase [Candidatus Eremiobacteraeota bacterium]
QYALEFRLRGSDGTYRWFFGRSTPLKDGAGKVVRWLGAAVNVDEVKRQQAREAFLAEAGALLGASLSAHDTLENIARAGIPYLADWCHVDLTQPNGSQETVAVAHRRPEGQAPARRFLARMRQEGRVTLATAAVARSGISTILEGGPRRDGVATFGGSTLLAALRAGGKTLGIVSFHYSESGRRHSDEDIALADEFCARAALAYDNAQLYESEHVALERARRLTGALQRAFLPSTLPQYERFRLDAVYLPADDDSRVGGDWYDAVPLEDGRIAFSIGDVGGHGMEAALAMSRVRQTILTCALVCETPAEVLAQTNRVIVQTGLPFTTCLAGIFDPKSGRGAYATAGQPAPIVATREGESRLLSYDGPPLGIDATTEYRVFPFTLEPGSIGLFYTDGLLEFDRDVVGNERRLLDIAADLGRDHGTHPAISFQHRLMDGAPHRDDVAVLAIAAT